MGLLLEDKLCREYFCKSQSPQNLQRLSLVKNSCYNEMYMYILLTAIGYDALSSVCAAQPSCDSLTHGVHADNGAHPGLTVAPQPARDPRQGQDHTLDDSSHSTRLTCTLCVTCMFIKQLQFLIKTFINGCMGSKICTCQ